jgi:hypothetical protein
MSTPSPVADKRTIEDVLADKDKIIAACIANNDRRGYFCGLYRHVTLSVQKGIQETKNALPGTEAPFDDADRMGRFDVIFADRYLDAYKANDAGDFENVSDCWKITFDAAKEDDNAIMQHMWAGMNAHICLDLGIAVAQICVLEAADKGTKAVHEFALFKGDYDKINELLAALVPIMDCKLDVVSATYKNLSTVVENRWPNLIMAAMVVARELAWNYARRHVALHDEGREEADTQIRDQLTYLLNKELLRLGPIFNRMERREEREDNSVGDIVTIIAATDDACAANYQRTALRRA